MHESHVCQTYGGSGVYHSSGNSLFSTCMKSECTAHVRVGWGGGGGVQGVSND